jgi:hypothetical protein
MISKWIKFRDMFKAKKRRALSSVVTAAIFLSAASIIGIAAIGGLNTNVTTHQTEFGGMLAANHNKINENIFIEHVWFGDTGLTVNMTMSNTGTVGLNVTEIKIQNMNSGQTYTYEKTDAGIVQGGEISFNQTMSPDWETGTPYDIFITTNRGNIFNAEVLSP